MATDNFYFHLQNRLIQTSQTGGQQYSDTSPFITDKLLTDQFTSNDKEYKYALMSKHVPYYPYDAISSILT